MNIIYVYIYYYIYNYNYLCYVYKFCQKSSFYIFQMH